MITKQQAAGMGAIAFAKVGLHLAWCISLVTFIFTFGASSEGSKFAHNLFSFAGGAVVAANDEHFRGFEQASETIHEKLEPTFKVSAVEKPFTFLPWILFTGLGPILVFPCLGMFHGFKFPEVYEKIAALKGRIEEFRRNREFSSLQTAAELLSDLPKGEKFYYYDRIFGASETEIRKDNCTIGLTWRSPGKWRICGVMRKQVVEDLTIEGDSERSLEN